MNKFKIVLFVYALFLLIASSVIKRYFRLKKAKKTFETYAKNSINFIEKMQFDKLEIYYNNTLFKIKYLSKINENYLKLVEMVEEIIKVKDKVENYDNKLIELKEIQGKI